MDEPRINIRLSGGRKHYQSEETLTGEIQVDAAEDVPLRAVEVSVLWYTEGQGDEDFGVHWFQRYLEGDEHESLRAPHKLAVTLPRSPLTYDGLIIKIRWCVRVRVFLSRGREFAADMPFQLGMVPSPRRRDVEAHA